MIHKKFYGQHFLRDERYLSRIVDAAELNSEETVLEIGPGDGALTRLLVERAKRVVAVEVDKEAVNALKQCVQSVQTPPWARLRLDIYYGDILNVTDETLEKWTGGPFVLVSNIPYNITSEIIRKFLTRDALSSVSPSRAVLLLQKEVTERIVAGAGDMNMLALAVQLYGISKKLFTVPAGAFSPPPKVDSAVLVWRRYTTDERKNRGVEEPERILHFAQSAFDSKRKQLQNTLGGKYGKEAVSDALTSLGLSTKSRPEDLSVERWIKVFHSLVK